MKVTYSNQITDDFTVEETLNGMCSIKFYENEEAVQEEDPAEEGEKGQTRTVYQYDVYELERRYYPLLATDIQNNRNAWYMAARAEDERRTPVDEYQLRADVDYQGVMLEVMSPISLMSVSAGSDHDVLEMARKYYPMRWNEDRLRVLVAANKLTSSDFESITGVPYSSEVIS